ncbi:MAG: DUF4388 domain-containing protein [Anaerolineae bacterium]
MALQGNLSDLDIADLIQINCQSGQRARLTVRQEDAELTLYFDGGGIVHAVHGDRTGEEVVYELMSWETGTFEVQQGVAPPQVTIEIPCSALIMEGLRQVDEAHYSSSESSTSVSEPEKELDEMATETRSERLTRILNNVVERSSDIQGVAAISMDGLIISAVVPPRVEQMRVGAIAAAILSLSGRSVSQLARGDFQQTLIQGSDGNIVITPAGPNALFVALTGSGANMGMVFLEVREGAQAVADVLSG